MAALVSQVKPHDLLWLCEYPADTAVDWVKPDWPVVVRRDHGPGRIPIGIRGLLRSQRMAAWTTAENIARVVRPHDLVAMRAWELLDQTRLACLRALPTVARQLADSGLSWGPTGSVGHALATEQRCGLRDDSDLDLCVRARTPLTSAQWASLSALQSCVDCRLDIQIDSGQGGFALTEWLAGRGGVLLKTARGPRMVRDPWAAPEQDAAA